MIKAVNLGEQLRTAIRRSGLTRNQIAKRTDISYSVIHGFMAGTSDIQLATAAKLAAVVGLEFAQAHRRSDRAEVAGRA